MTQSFRTKRGAQAYLEESYDLPLVDFVIGIRGGAALDPVGQEGLTRIMARALRRGAVGQSQSDVDEQLARLGSRLSLSTGRETIRIQGSVLARNLEPFVELMARLLFNPALRQRDLAQIKRMIRADLVAMQDDDYSLAARHLRDAGLQAHPYGRPIGGTSRSLRSIDRAGIDKRWRQAFVADNVVFGAAGAVDRRTLEKLIDTHFSKLSRRKPKALSIPTPKLGSGRRLRIVHKPERTQTQIAVATLGAKSRDRSLVPLIVADAAFGGMFTSTLSQEVRAKRGWSYSVYSSLGFARERELWQMWSHPSVTNAVDCLKLELDLLERWCLRGCSASDLRRAKKYLAASRCFDVDTAARRLDLALDTWLHELPKSHHSGFVERVKAVTREQANNAVRKRISSEDLQLVVVGDARRLEAPLSEIDGITQVSVVPFDKPI